MEFGPYLSSCCRLCTCLEEVCDGSFVLDWGVDEDSFAKGLEEMVISLIPLSRTLENFQDNNFELTYLTNNIIKDFLSVDLIELDFLEVYNDLLGYDVDHSYTLNSAEITSYYYDKSDEL